MIFCYAMSTIFSYCDELEKRPISFGLDMNLKKIHLNKTVLSMPIVPIYWMREWRHLLTLLYRKKKKKSSVASKSPLKGLIFYGHPSTENK